MIPPNGSDFAYKVQNPVGVERIRAIACVDPILTKVESLQEELKVPLPAQTEQPQKPSQGEVFLSMKDPGTVLKDIGVVFSKVDPSKWATVELTFKIADSGTSSPTAPPPAATPAPTAPPQN